MCNSINKFSTVEWLSFVDIHGSVDFTKRKITCLRRKEEKGRSEELQRNSHVGYAFQYMGTGGKWTMLPMTVAN